MIWNFLRRDVVDIYRGLSQRWMSMVFLFGIGSLLVARFPTSFHERGQIISFLFLAWYLLAVQGLAPNRAVAHGPFFVHGAHQDYLRALPVNRQKMFYVVTLRRFLLALPLYLSLIGLLCTTMQFSTGGAPFHSFPFLAATFFLFLCVVPPAALRSLDSPSAEISWRDWPRLLGLRLVRLCKHAAYFAFWALYLMVPGIVGGSIVLAITMAVGVVVAVYNYRKLKRVWICDPSEREPYLAKAA